MVIVVFGLEQHYKGHPPQCWEALSLYQNGVKHAAPVVFDMVETCPPLSTTRVFCAV